MSRTAHEHSVPGKQLYKRPERKYLWNHPETKQYVAKDITKNGEIHNKITAGTFDIGVLDPRFVNYVSSSKNKQEPIAFYKTEKPTPRKNKTHDLQYLFVHPDHRSSGIGRQVLNRLKDQAVKGEAEGVHLSPLKAAIPFYQRNGFELTNDGYMMWNNPEIRRWVPHQAKGTGRAGKRKF
jgi:GNAT superfamily N-acetyltransferase